jgi:class 3 adenylate cyclase/predicted ATPase
MECPSCHSATSEEARFCDTCGAALPSSCAACGAVNRAGARFCSNCGKALTADSAAQAAADAPSRPITSSAERRQLTIALVDLVGSTALSAGLDPEDMREIVAAYHRCCAEQIKRAGGFVAKYMGDGVLAYFGYPQAHEDDAERAVRCALALTQSIHKLPTPKDTPFQVRIGIATGLVVVGDLIGEGAGQEQGVVGDAPNLAARLQSLAEPGQVVISQGTRRLTGGSFEYHDLGRVPLKGLTDPVQAWRVTGTSAVQSRFEARHEAQLTPLVGREEELELLMRRWRQAASGEGRVVLLSGEPGIGKSRLTVALQERLQAEPHTRLRYFCSPQHTDSAFYPIVIQLERTAAFERHDTAEVRLDKLTALLGSSAGREREFQLLAELLSIPTDDRYTPLDWSAQRKKEATLRALLRQLEMLSRRQPVLMIYEDAHWIDPSTRELLDITVERVAHLPVLLVITFRPEFTPPWTGQAHVTALNLSRLGRRDGATLAGSVAGKTALSDATIEEIIERTDGIPLFVEELTKAVVEAGAREADVASTLKKGTLSTTAVPAALHASLIARLDRLGPVAKEVAQTGAAIGREFSYEVLAPIAHRSDAEVQTALTRLTQAGLLFCRGVSPQATFLFKHALVRDVAYGSLLRGQRQQLHARIATTLEVRFPELVEQQPEIVAQHCTDAELIAEAITYWSKAARQSLARYATIEAVAHARRGLNAVMSRPDSAARWRQELELQSVLAGALNASIGAAAEETGRVYARARVLAERIGDTAALAAVLCGQSAHHAQRCELAANLEVGEDLLRLGAKENDATCRMIGHRVKGSSLYWLGEFVAARDQLEHALRLYDPEAHRTMIAIGGFDSRSTALSNLSYVLFILGYPDAALLQSRRALSWARELNHPHVLIHALSMASCYNLARGAVEAAEDVTRESLDLAAEQGFHFWAARARVVQGLVLAERGEKPRGLALARKCLADKAPVSALWRPFYLGFMAKACDAIGQGDEALDLLAEALKIAENTGERHYEAELHRLRGECLATHRHGQQAEAETSYLRAMTVAQRQQAKLWELRASLSLARLWRDQGKRTEARELLAPIYGWFTEGFEMPDLMEANALLSELG